MEDATEADLAPDPAAVTETDAAGETDHTREEDPDQGQGHKILNSENNLQSK